MCLSALPVTNRSYLGSWISSYCGHIHSQASRGVEACHTSCTRQRRLHLLSDMALWQGHDRGVPWWPYTHQLERCGITWQLRRAGSQGVHTNNTQSHDQGGNSVCNAAICRRRNKVKGSWIRRSGDPWVCRSLANAMARGHERSLAHLYAHYQCQWISFGSVYARQHQQEDG